MTTPSYVRLQITVFTLVSAAFTNIYITQPVLPVLQHEFSADMVVVSLTVSAVILGIACSNLPCYTSFFTLLLKRRRWRAR